jgi:hypothetical protein
VRDAAERVNNVNRRGLLQLFRATLALRAAPAGTAPGDILGQVDDSAIENAIASMAFNKRRYVWRYVEECVRRGPRAADGSSPFVERLAAVANRLGRQDAILLGDSLRALALATSGQSPAALWRRLGVPDEGAWRVAGPYDNRAGFDHRYPPEDGGDVARSVAWRAASDSSPDGYVDMNALFDRRPWSVGYAAIDLLSPDQRVVQIRAFSSEPYKLWLNGEPVWKAYGRKEIGLDRDLVTVVLRPGRNRLLVKALSTTSDWGFFLRLTDESGAGQSGVDFAPPA